MTTKILFIANSNKTKLFRSISEHLEKKYSIESVWISHSLYWTKYLLNTGVNPARVTTISHHLKKTLCSNNKERRTEAKDYDERSNNWITKYILSDRVFSKFEYDVSTSYSQSILQSVGVFLEEHSPRIIISEHTWLSELLTCKLAEARNIPSLYPCSARFPGERCLFFYGPTQEYFYPLEDIGQVNVNVIEKAYEEFNSVAITPPYMKFHQNTPLPKFAWIEIFALQMKERMADAYDPQRYPFFLSNQIWEKIKQPLRVFNQQRFFSNFNKEAKYQIVLFPLHVQPEASIDVMGEPFSDQISTISCLARKLPMNYRLVVKEHPHAIGRRPNNFYKSLLEIPNVLLIKPWVTTRDIAIKSSLVISITGTASLEAALLGKPSCTLKKLFFSEILSHSEAVNPFDDNFSFEKLLESTPKPKDAIIKYLQKIYSNSVECSALCPSKNPDVLDIENTIVIANAIKRIVEHQECVAYTRPN